VKRVKMTCVESSGFVFPALKPNIAINEWGLVKTMCSCTSNPAWLHRTPPKCTICQRNRDEKKAEKEKKRQKLIAATEEEYEKKAYSAETSDESIGVKVNGSSDSCH
jgi:hypothetical protein